MMTEQEQMDFEELGMFTYQHRERRVLRTSTPACKSKGHNHAKCVRLPKHKGYCEGPGFDEWGPKYCAWKSKSYVPGTPLPSDRRLA